MHPPDTPPRSMLDALGVHTTSFYDNQRMALQQMGVPSTAIFDSDQKQLSTRDEARYIMSYARARGFQRIIVVTSPYHTRRAGSMITRLAGRSPAVVMRADRYERVDPDRWWRLPADRSDVVLEYLKTVYAVGST
jgi:uncharacterized SAM-binding protein YcdF (DUF218 family)